ncbi:MAG: SH3 domain-containing protein [Chloroflexi bacterium]|nr:SH3 domain-containing protein [Chloroflexota bacterium]
MKNNGTAPWSYFVRAILSDSNGVKTKEYSTTLLLDLVPGNTTTVGWIHTITTAEDFNVRFEVWTGTPVPPSILLAIAPNTGSVFITAHERVKFNNGEKVVTNANVNVYRNPGLNSPEITDPNYHSLALDGTRGNVLDGPISATGAEWWLVRFDRGYEGWVQEEFLDKF